jgi:hypothetical protein
MQEEWLICIHERFCGLPFLAQLLIHEMTYVLLPAEVPYHSQKFWDTLREKWLIDFPLVVGEGLNDDEIPQDTVAKVLLAKAAADLFGH